MFQNFQNMLTCWYLLGWRMAVEVVFFAALFYYTVRWLSNDKTKNLVLWFYAYCAAAFGAHIFNLPTMAQFLFLFGPAAVMVFVLLHQETLQRNYIVTKNITPARQTNDWLGDLMSVFLGTVSKNKPVICVIEKTDALCTLLSSPLTFNTQIQKNLLDILLNSTAFEGNKMIWINHHGQLIALNASWHQLDDEWFRNEIADDEAWKQDAILLTNKTDALVFKISPNRTVDLIAQQKLIEQVSIHEALLVIKHYLYGKEKTESVPTARRAHEHQKSI